MAILSLTVSALALAVSVAAAVYGRRQANEAKRANDLLESDLARRLEQERQEELANQVRWVVEDAGAAGYVLRNRGTQAARGVKVASSSSPFTSGPISSDAAFAVGGNGLLYQDVVEPKGGIRFGLAPTSAFDGGSHDLRVVWSGHDEAVIVPLPPRPLDPRPAPSWRRP